MKYEVMSQVLKKLAKELKAVDVVRISCNLIEVKSSYFYVSAYFILFMVTMIELSIPS